jgi:hypothetical protein
MKKDKNAVIKKYLITAGCGKTEEHLWAKI